MPSDAHADSSFSSLVKFTVRRLQTLRITVNDRVVINGVAVNADILNTYYATVASGPMYSAERAIAYSKEL